MAVLVLICFALISHLVAVGATVIRLGDQDVGPGENHWIARVDGFDACSNRVVFNQGQVLKNSPSPCNTPFTLVGSTYQFQDCDTYSHPRSIYDGSGNKVGVCAVTSAGQVSCSSAPIYWIVSCPISGSIANAVSSSSQSSAAQTQTQMQTQTLATVQSTTSSSQTVPTTISSSTVTMSSTASRSTTTAADQANQTTPTSAPAASSGYTREEKIGLGVGIGFGIPMFLLASATLCLQLSRRHR